MMTHSHCHFLDVVPCSFTQPRRLRLARTDCHAARTMIPPLIAQHFERLRRLHPGARVREVPAAQGVLVEVPDVPLPPGIWNSQATTVRFIVPFAYPSAPPDSFWTDTGLALRDGRPPQGARPQPIPGENDPLLWFSWHPQQWDPNAHTISSFLEVVKNRLRTAQ